MLLEKRINLLKEMDDTVRNFDDEDLIMRWLANGVPDCADEEDFTEIAEDEECYDYCCRLFKKLTAIDEKGGVEEYRQYCREQEVKDLVQTTFGELAEEKTFYDTQNSYCLKISPREDEDGEEYNAVDIEEGCKYWMENTDIISIKR